MKIKTLVFAGAMSALCGAAMAGDDSAALQLARKTVASKNYVDDTFATKNYTDSTFQTKIPAKTYELSQMFGDTGMVLAATSADGVVTPRLILPGYRNGQRNEFSTFVQQTANDFLNKPDFDVYQYMDEDFTAAVEDMWRYARGDYDWEPYNFKYSIPSMELLVELINLLNDKVAYISPELDTPDKLSAVLMPTSNPNMTDYRFIIPGLDTTVSGVWPAPLSVRTWALFGGDRNNDEVLAQLDDISHQFGNETGWANPSMSLDDVLFSPASLQLVSDVWKESQREIPAAGYAKAATGAANAVALTTGSGSAATDWLNAAVKGTGLVTKTATEGQIGERKVFEESDYQNYQAANLSTNEKNIQKISIPTMGAVMAAVNANTVTLPTGTAGNVVTYDANGAIGGSVAPYTGAATYAPATDSAKIPTMAGVAAYVDAHSPTIPAPTGDCLNAANHCALVTTYANGVITYTWTVMAK